MEYALETCMKYGTSLLFFFGCSPTSGTSYSLNEIIYSSSSLLARWMTGEVHDYEYVDAAPISEHYSYSSTVLLICATIWLIFFYAFILPCNLIPVTKVSLV
jgi:hypothetical protein